jgi:hypothetical protein
VCYIVVAIAKFYIVLSTELFFSVPMPFMAKFVPIRGRPVRLADVRT